MEFKVAVCSVVYNEAECIRSCYENWRGTRHLFLVSTKPWNGSPQEDDGTVDILRELGAEYVLGYWPTEAEQRNWALARLYDYDYVIMVDPDELYTEEDKRKILARLNDPFDYDNRVMKPLPAFRLGKMRTYWKGSDYVLDPPDTHQTILAVDPKRVRFFSLRNIQPTGAEELFMPYVPVIDATCHHFSWAKSDQKIKEKIQSYSHSDAIPGDWFERVWLGWAPGDMKVRPYGLEQSVAKYSPAPEEIVDLRNR